MLLPLLVQAAQLTATVESYNSASLSGNMPNELTVSYLNQGSTKGQVVAGGTATLTIQNWPDATIQGITMYVHSNKASGAANVRVSVCGHSWLAAEGNFNQWPGLNNWSETFQPMTVMSQQIHMEEDSTLTIEITGTTNSVYLQKIEVDYTLTPPVPHTVTLQYPSHGGPRQIILMENKAHDGVILPSVPSQDSVLSDGGYTWYWYGWSEQTAEGESTPPLCWQTGDWYGPENDTTLYAIYTNQPQRTIIPTTQYVDGEYALMLVIDVVDVDDTTHFPHLIQGNWSDHKMMLVPQNISQTQSGQWQWTLDLLNDSCRYQIDFEGDSLTIFHVASQTYIGHNQSSGSNQLKPYKWAWQTAADSTILIYGARRKTPDCEYVSCLTLNIDNNTSAYSVAYQEDKYLQDWPYWHLYSVSDMPTSSDARYSSLSNYVALTEIPVSPSPTVKILDHQGRIILYNHHLPFTILGTPL